MGAPIRELAFVDFNVFNRYSMTVPAPPKQRKLLDKYPLLVTSIGVVDE